MNILSSILNIFFPISCLSCKNSGTIICDSCLHDLPRVLELPEEHTISLYEYRTPVVKSLMWHLKYKNARQVAKRLAGPMYSALFDEINEKILMEGFTEPLIIGVPISKKKLRERGYNQSELLAKAILEHDKNKLFEFAPKVLKKIKDTEPQARIKNRKRRLGNVKNTFAVANPALVKGRNIIVIDDITTTGATLAEARRALSTAGAKSVLGFTVAH